MPLTRSEIPTRASLVDRALAFLRRGLIARGVSPAAATAATARGTDRALTMEAVAQNVEVLLANALALEDATLPDTAIADDLERICAIYGLVRSAGAGASGDVTVTCTGVVTYAAGLECVSAAGKRYRVVAATAASSGDPVPVIGIDVGDATNLDAGAVLTWTNPPFGSATTATVASGGLTDGKNADTDDRLRERLFKLLREPQNGGSWAHYRQWAEAASAAVENAYVYPAAQGPGTVHVAFTVEGTAANRYARAASVALVLAVANAVVAEQPEFADVTVTTVAEEPLDLALKILLPEPLGAGGPGGGWYDPPAARWASAVVGAGAVDGVVLVTSVSNASTFETNATAQPLDGTRVCFFSAADRQVHTATVVGDGTGAAGAWTFQIDRALPTVAVGDYLAPGCEQAAGYATTVQQHVAALAPGEKTSDASVLPRAYRHPRGVEGFPSGLTTALLVALQGGHREVVNAAFFALGGTVGVALPTEPPLPASVLDPPRVWRVRRLAFSPS